MDIKQQKLFEALNQSLSFIDFNKLDLSNLKTYIEFRDGHVRVKPFSVTYQDIEAKISGVHSFDKQLDYQVVLQVPAKYLGSEVNRLIGKLDDTSINTLKIPVTANLTGSLSKPKVKTDLTSGVKSLTQKLIEIEKQKLKTKGKAKIKDMLGDVLNTPSSK